MRETELLWPLSFVNPLWQKSSKIRLNFTFFLFCFFFFVKIDFIILALVHFFFFFQLSLLEWSDMDVVCVLQPVGQGYWPYVIQPPCTALRVSTAHWASRPCSLRLGRGRIWGGQTPHQDGGNDHGVCLCLCLRDLPAPLPISLARSVLSFRLCLSLTMSHL